MSKEGHTIAHEPNAKVRRRYHEGNAGMWFLSKYFPEGDTMSSRGLHGVVL